MIQKSFSASNELSSSARPHLQIQKHLSVSGMDNMNVNQGDDEEIFLEKSDQGEITKEDSIISSYSHSNHLTFELTLDQFEYISKKLPKGYSLRPIIGNVSKKTSSKKEPTKKLQISNVIGIPVKKPSLIREISDFLPPPKMLEKNLSSMSQTAISRDSLRDRKKLETDLKKSQSTSSATPKQPQIEVPKNLSDIMTQCFKLIQDLKKHHDSFSFHKPVDPVALNIPDYFQLVKEPMDLGTVEQKICKGDYKNPNEFTSDVRKIWSNSLLYNSKETRIYKMTLNMQKFFEERLEEMKKKNEENSNNDLSSKIQNLINLLKKTFEKPPGEVSYMLGPKMLRKIGKESNTLPKVPVTKEKLFDLQNKVKNLPVEHSRGILEIAKDYIYMNGDMCNIDLSELPGFKIRQIERYVDRRLKNKEKTRERMKRKIKMIERSLSATNEDEKLGSKEKLKEQLDHLRESFRKIDSKTVNTESVSSNLTDSESDDPDEI